MTENSVRTNRENSTRFQKSTSVISGVRCDTPESVGSGTGGSPGPANFASTSPTPITNPSVVANNSPTSGFVAVTASSANTSTANFHNHSGAIPQRLFNHRGRSGGSYGHGGHHQYHGGSNHHSSYYRSSSPPYSKPLLDFMLNQWQCFETNTNRRSIRTVGISEDNAPPTTSTRSHGHANSPHRQPSQRHMHPSGGSGGWVGGTGGGRRYMDGGVHHGQNNLDRTSDFSSDMGGGGGSVRRIRGSAHNSHTHQYGPPEHAWQRGHITARKNSPNNHLNRNTGLRSSGSHVSAQVQPALSNTPPVTELAATHIAATTMSTSLSFEGPGLQNSNNSASLSPTCSMEAAMNEKPATQKVTSAELNESNSSGPVSAVRSVLGVSNGVKIQSQGDVPRAKVTSTATPTEQACEATSAHQPLAMSVLIELESQESSTRVQANGAGTYSSVCESSPVSSSNAVSSAKLIPCGKNNASAAPSGTCEQSNSLTPSAAVQHQNQRVIAESLPVSLGVGRTSTSMRTESVSVSICSSSFGSLDQADALSNAEQYWTPDPPSSPTTLVSPVTTVGVAAVGGSQFFQQTGGVAVALSATGLSPIDTDAYSEKSVHVGSNGSGNCCPPAAATPIR